MKNIIIASTSTLYGGEFLDYLLPTLEQHFSKAQTILFVPYARPSGISHDQYTEKVKESFKKINKEVVGIHQTLDPIQAIEDAQGIFIGGGNTFLLVKQLYKNDVVNKIIDKVNAGTPYLGCSAGSNICGLTMETTNDMPITYPPTFKTFGFVPFNINPHYLDPLPQSTHMGETRETRINEFHTINSQPVVGLREGSWLEVNGANIVLKGELSARIFQQNKQAVEIPTGSNLNELK